MADDDLEDWYRDGLKKSGRDKAVGPAFGPK